MAALLILAGLLLIFLGWLWLIVSAFGVSLLWGIGSLLPPVLCVFVVRCWKVACKGVVVIALGFVPLIVGLTQLASVDSTRIESLFNLSWLQETESVQSSTQIDLNGELYGQPFRPQYGELIDGVLLLREGKDFFAQRELRIALPSSAQNSTQGLRLDVLPQDSGELPEIEIMWLLPDQSLPEARRVGRGYTLHLDLQAQAPNLLTGNFHLVLPPQFNTSMSGEIQLLTNRLRYLEGQVDRTYDDVSTLEYVVHDYLERRFNQDGIVVEPFATPESFNTPLAVTIRAYIDGQLRTMSLSLNKDAQARWLVEGDQYPARAVQQKRAVAPAAALEQVSAKPTLQRSVDRRVRFSLQRLLVNPAQYQGLQVHVETVQGNQVKGRFVGLDTEGALIISRELKAPGTVSFALFPEEVRQMTLLEP